MNYVKNDNDFNLKIHIISIYKPLSFWIYSDMPFLVVRDNDNLRSR